MKNEEHMIDHLVPLFVCGHPKSGTTLLVSLLDSHPELLVFPEEVVMEHVLRESTPAGRWARMMERSDVVLPGQGLVDLPNGRRDYRHIDGEAYLRDLREAIGAAREDRDYLLAVFRVWLKHAPPEKPERLKYMVEKTPTNMFLYSTYRRWFPSARFIHILRDPRDNYVSYVKKRGGWKLEKFADDWGHSTRLASERKDEPHYHVLRYEDLVARPEEEMQRISAFLAVDFNETLLTPTRGGTVWEGNSMFGDNRGAIHAKAAGRYKEHLEPAITEKLEAYLFDEMTSWGYAPDYASARRSLPLPYRLDAALHEWVFRLKTGGRVVKDK